MWFVAPENDYRALAPVPDAALRVGVVIPVYNRVELLARTVAGLVHQQIDGDLSVVVADDGSDEDVRGALAPLERHLDIAVVRREHEGYGAGQARNLGAERADADVLVFVDADCVPDPHLVARHAGWHAAADNVVVIGSRHPLDTTDVTVDRLVAGDVDLRRSADMATSDGAAPGDELMPSDWRRVLYRRTARLRRGDEAYRSLVSSNFSIRRDCFLESGGFDEEFQRWGGEDTELGWRLATAGLFFVPEDGAIVYHQIQEDAGPEAWRQEARSRNDGIIRAKIPHRFYRTVSRPGIRYQVPKVTVIAGPIPDARAEPLVDDLLRQNLTDWDAVLIGDGEGLQRLGEEIVGDSRFEVVRTDGDLDAALLGASRRARGEYVAFVDGSASLDHRLLARTVRALDRRPRDGRASVGYRVAATGGGAIDHRRHDDAADLDLRAGPGPLPAFGLVRRREIGKALGVATDCTALWSSVTTTAPVAHLGQALVGLALTPDDRPPTFRSRRSMLTEDLRRARTPRQVVGAGVRALRRSEVSEPRTRATGQTVPQPRVPVRRADAASEAVPIRYVGWVGHDNLGDEILLRAVRQLLPWAELRTGGDPSRCVLLGGGTLINRGYLRQLERMDSPRIERAVFGSGVANPEYWGEPRESPQAWIEYLSTCAFVGVRGPISEQILRGWGYRGALRVVGDPALAIDRPAIDRQPGRVVVSLAHARGELWGGDDQAVVEILAEAIARLCADGRDVRLLSCSPRDDLDGLLVMRAAGEPDLPYVAGYRDPDSALALLASADVVIGERLHAVVLAAACDTPFVALEYRPKLRDFARSVGVAGQVIRTDHLDVDRLLGLLSATLARADELRGVVAEHVARYRAALAEASEILQEAVT